MSQSKWFEQFSAFGPTKEAFGAVVNDISGRAVVAEDLLPAAEQFKSEYPSCPYSAIELVDHFVR